MHNARIYWDDHKVSVPDHPWMRVEDRLRPKVSWPHVAQIENPFAILQIRRFCTNPTQEQFTDRLSTVMLALARYEGLDATLMRLSKQQRKTTIANILAMQEPVIGGNHPTCGTRISIATHRSISV